MAEKENDFTSGAVSRAEKRFENSESESNGDSSSSSGSGSDDSPSKDVYTLQSTEREALSQIENNEYVRR